MNEKKVIKPSLSPTITLRRGNTEIEVKNAAAIIKKIEDSLPRPKSESPITEKTLLLEKQIKWVEQAKNWFKQEMFGGNGDFEIIVKEPEEELSKSIQNEEVIEEETYKPSKELLTDSPKSYQSTPIKSVNKNAYEIRLDVLKESMAFLQWKHSGNASQLLPDEDDVLNLAQKFYKFVENKR